MNSDNREVLEFAKSLGWLLEPKLANNAHLILTHPRIKQPVFLSLNGCVKKFNKRSLIKAMRDAGLEVQCPKHTHVPCAIHPSMHLLKTTNAERRHRKPRARSAMMEHYPSGSFTSIGQGFHAPL